MTKIIVASFSDEKKAMNAFSKLNEMESAGYISLYDKVILRKSNDGKYETLKAGSNDDWMTLGGMAVGGLLGTFGGPIGFVIGLYIGAAVGAVVEIEHYQFEGDFINNVESKMTDGTVSIIAEIDEDDNDFINVSLVPMGAVLLKSTVGFEHGRYEKAAMDEIENKVAEQRAALKKATEAERKKIELSITKLKEKRKQQLTAFDAVVNNAVKGTAAYK